MFCSQCGSPVEEGAKFCPACGKNLQPAPRQPEYQPLAYEQPAYQQPVYQQPVYQQPVYQAQPTANPTLNNNPILVYGILALAFACSFIASFMGIAFGIVCANKVKAYLAAGGTLTGKAKVGKILGKVGLILGIVMTVLFVLYVISIVVLVITTGNADYSVHFYY